MARLTTPPHVDRESRTSSETVRVFVSYTHDSPTHKRRVLQFADQLRDDGIDCELDQYEEAPPDGWPTWMANQIRQAKYVLVVCTAAYHRRVTGAEQQGIGLGARWEGALITQDLYERGGRNDKFIPVVFDSSDLSEIPDFLRHTTHYDLSDASRQESLYRRLTDQPQVVRKPIGVVRQLPKDHLAEPEPTQPPTAKSPTRGVSEQGNVPVQHEATAVPAEPKHTALPVALIREPTSQPHFIPILSAEVRGEETTAVLLPSDGVERAFLENLANRRFGLPTVDFVFGKTAIRARLNSVVRTFEGNVDRFTLVLGSDTRPEGNSMEMSTNGVSADDIARLRARRILLDETLQAAPGRSRVGFGEDGMLETLVRGLNTSVEVERSPLPDLVRNIGMADKRRVLAAAELTAILWLRLSGTVAHIFELELKFNGANALAVRFRGARGRVYTNKEPEIIEVDGVCPLG